MTHLDAFLSQFLAIFELCGMNTDAFVQLAIGDSGKIWLLRTKACGLYKLLACDTSSTRGSLDVDGPLLRLSVILGRQDLG